MTVSPTNGSAPSLGRTIVRNTVFFTLGRAALKGFSFLFGVFVVRQLGDAEFGRYSIVTAWIGLFSIFVELGITQYVTREMGRSGERVGSIFWNLLAIRLGLAFVGVLAIPAAAAWVGYDNEITLGVFVYTATFILSAFQAPLDAALIANEQLGWATTLVIVGQVAWLILGSVVVWIQPNFLSLIGVGLVAMLPQLALSAWVAARLNLIDWTVRIQPATWPNLIRAGLPFGVISLALTIAFSIDTVMLSWFVSDAEVGWYNVAYGLVRSFVALLTGFSVAMQPTLTKVYATDRVAVARWHARSIRFIALLALPVAVGGMLTASPLISFLYNPDVFPAARALAIIVWDVPLLMVASVSGNITTVIGEERAAARIGVINAVANVALNLILIPRFGMLGAAVVTVVTDLIATLQFNHLLTKKLGLPNYWRLLVRAGLASVGLGIAVWLADDQPVWVLIAIGALMYSALALALRAVDPEDWALAIRAFNALRNRFQRSG